MTKTSHSLRVEPQAVRDVLNRVQWETVQDSMYPPLRIVPKRPALTLMTCSTGDVAEETPDQRISAWKGWTLFFAILTPIAFGVGLVIGRMQ